MQENIQKIDKSFLYKDFECLTLSVLIPTVEKSYDKHGRINKFYQHKASQIIKIAEKTILPVASAEMQDAIDGTAFMRLWSVKADCKITYQSECFFSVFREINVFRGRKLYSTFGESESWNTVTGFPQPITAFIRTKHAVSKKLKEYKTHANVNKLPKLSYDDFYLTKNGIVIFHPIERLHILLPSTQYALP